MNTQSMLKITILIVLLFVSQSYALSTPNISANALFLYRNSNFHKADKDPLNLDSDPNGLDIQETELQIYSDVDPYTRLNLVLSIAPSYESDGTAVEQKWGIEPEEAFVESNILPSTTLKIGKFKAFMGKQNLLHTHAFSFIESPLINKNLLGDEGLNDVGFSAAVLLPAAWYSELTLQYLRGKGENAEFNSPSPSEGVGLAHWKNLFDLTSDLTLEVGTSYASGMNSFKKITSLVGADLTLKWRPTTAGNTQFVAWATEYLGRTQAQSNFDDEKGSGLVSWIQYQFIERWSVLYRFDSLKIENTFDSAALPNQTSSRHSAGLMFSPSEFSNYKLEFDQRKNDVANANNETVEKTIYLQANFTIGTHPSHSY